MIIFEDDVVLRRGFRKRHESVQVSDGWRVIYLKCPFRQVPEPVAPSVVRVWGRCGRLTR